MFNAVTNNHLHAGASQSNAIASGLAGAALLLAIFSAAGIALSVLVARHRLERAKAVHLAAAAAASSHTIPHPWAGGTVCAGIALRARS